MTRSCDPRAPRPNPEIRDIRRAMAKKWRELERSQNFKQLRGNAAVLRAHLDMLLDEPEFLFDLEPIPPGAERELISVPRPEISGRDPFEPETLAEMDPEARFFRTYGGGTTRLFPPDALAEVDPFGLSAYWVQIVKPVFLSEGATRMRLTSEAALRRCAPARKASRDAPHHLILDPLGWTGKSAPTVNRYVRLSAAIQAAERLGEWLEIRFLVATVTGVVHTH